MTDEDMFETMDRILGEIGKGSQTGAKVCKGDGSLINPPTNSKPSHPFWKVLDVWPSMKIYLSADQLELWGVESE